VKRLPYNQRNGNGGEEKVDKDRLVAALTAIQEDAADAVHFHDELETLITLVINAKDEDIAAAWEDFHTDDDKTE
jgi:hypothetical protein